MSERRVLTDVRVTPGEPLWRRVPSRDADGRNLFDFMVLIPRFRDWPEVRRERAMGELRALFDEYSGRVYFAELNLQLNLLWVSVLPAPGLCLEFAAAINARIPEARLVANRAEALLGARRAGRRSWRLPKLLR